MYRMEITLKDGSKIIGPFTHPDNPNRNMQHPSIEKSLKLMAGKISKFNDVSKTAVISEFSK